ncbi:MAG TPA: carbonic anhydrase [Longimicrobiales bacterium]
MPRHLIEGLRRFRAEHFPRFREHYERLVAEGQKPTALFIGCSDSRVVPDVLMGTGPGELFIVRNVGNFVPPFEHERGYHGTSAAIEFGVLKLGVSDIIVCGHSHCGAVRALYDAPDPRTPHINHWLELGREARVEGDPTEEALRQTEQRSVALQLSRLMTYPMVREAVEADRLALHGWHYIIERGEVLILDVERGEFVSA